MTYDAFVKSIQNQEPTGSTPYLNALWHEKKGDWNKAHEIVQDLHSWEAAWIHAYLHRVEGDPGNAGYWYRKANKPVPKISLEDEWEELVTYFLTRFINVV